MQSIKIFIKGFIIGIGKIIPGVSGAMFAMLLGLYEDIVASLSSFRELCSRKKTIIPLGIGIVFAIIIGSNAIKFLLEKYYIQSMGLFIGMMLFGIVPLIKEIKNTNINFQNILIASILIIILTSLFMIDVQESSISMITGFRKMISLFLCGILDAASTIIPGISGTALLMIVGFYDIIISSLAGLAIPGKIVASFITIFPFLIGLALGIIFVSKIMNYIFKNYPIPSKLTVIGFASVSIVALVFNSISYVGKSSWYIFIMFIVLGFIFAYILENKLN